MDLCPGMRQTLSENYAAPHNFFLDVSATASYLPFAALQHEFHAGCTGRREGQTSTALSLRRQ